MSHSHAGSHRPEALVQALEAAFSSLPTDFASQEEAIRCYLRVIKHNLGAYLVDCVWMQFDRRVDGLMLRRVASLETEERGYVGTKIAAREIESPESLIGWCFVKGKSIWITDPDEVKRSRSYQNLWSADKNDVIPEGTVYEYNEDAKILTEICVPLRGSVDYYREEFREEVLGVLNIELDRALEPTPLIRGFLKEASEFLERAVDTTTIKRAFQRSQGISVNRGRDELQKLISLSKQLESMKGDHFPSLLPKAFIAYPYRGNLPESEDLSTQIRDSLAARGIECIDNLSTNETIQHKLIATIRSCNFGVAVTTDLNGNVLIEVGMMLALGKSVIVLHRDSRTSDVEPEPAFPSDLQKMRHYYRATAGSVDRNVFQATFRKAFNALLKEDPNLASLLVSKRRLDA